MKKLFLLPLLLLIVACHQRRPDSQAPSMQQVASFKLGESAELHLLTDSNLSQLELFYGGELQELAGTANTLFVADDEGRIALDTVHLDGGSSTQYIIRSYDRSSSYGAEVWYIVYPLDPKMEGDGPWSIARVPWDLPGLLDDGHGTSLVMYQNPQQRDLYYVYAFESGIFREVPSLRTAL